MGYKLTDTDYEVSQIERMSFILDAMHYNLIFIFFTDPCFHKANP